MRSFDAGERGFDRRLTKSGKTLYYGSMGELIRQHPFVTGVISVSLVLSLRLAFGLWLLPKFRAVPLVKKIFWSLVVLVPLVGPLFYGAFFNLPGHLRAGDGAQPGIPGAGY